MKNLLKGILLGAVAGYFVGWLLAERKREQQEQAERDAYANDPELVTIRKEIALENQVEAALDDVDDDVA